MSKGVDQAAPNKPNTGQALLVTRAEPDASRLCETLTALGHGALKEPLLSIEPTGAALPNLGDFQGLVFTSANGVRAFAACSEARALPVYAVGAATGEAARAEGFANVRVAGGDVDKLAALLLEKKVQGPLLQAAGTHRAGNLQRALAAGGLTLHRWVGYEAKAATGFSAPCRRFLTGLAPGQVAPGSEAAGAGVLLYSPRTATIFCKLLEAAGLEGVAPRLTAYCLSPAVGAQLQGLPFSSLEVAHTPDEPSLLALLPVAKR